MPTIINLDRAHTIAVDFETFRGADVNTHYECCFCDIGHILTIDHSDGVSQTVVYYSHTYDKTFNWASDALQKVQNEYEKYKLSKQNVVQANVVSSPSPKEQEWIE